MKDKTLKVEILDPTGNIVTTHHFHFMAGENNRIRLTVGDNNYILNSKGKLVILTQEEIAQERKRVENELQTLKNKDFKVNTDFDLKDPKLIEELKKLKDWLQSDEGKKAIEEAQIKAEETCKIIDKMRDIDPKLLTEPFNI